eukprot:TRINITY_DN3969_c0_g1_i1.p1 TRINITY_DN3969_c0_g1~~TRINITY_DN3969_c0_g1_i1.p1  ORF type:complete len:497 (-),score=76.08 TRINITY_DN3969_c0_g1_i1:64-1554(-)
MRIHSVLLFVVLLLCASPFVYGKRAPISAPGLDSTFNFQSNQKGYCSGNFLEKRHAVFEVDDGSGVCSVSNFVVDDDYNVYVALVYGGGDDCSENGVVELYALSVSGVVVDKVTVLEIAGEKYEMPHLYTVDGSVVVLTQRYGGEQVGFNTFLLRDEKFQSRWTKEIHITNFDALSFGYFFVPLQVATTDDMMYSMNYVDENTTALVSINPRTGEMKTLYPGFSSKNNYVLNTSPNMNVIYVTAQFPVDKKIEIHAFDIESEDIKVIWNLSNLAFDPRKPIAWFHALDDGIIEPFLNKTASVPDYSMYRFSESGESRFYEFQVPDMGGDSILVHSISAGTLFFCVGPEDYINSHCAGVKLNDEGKGETTFTRDSTNVIFYTYDADNHLLVLEDDNGIKRFRVLSEKGEQTRYPSSLNKNIRNFYLYSTENQQGLLSFVQTNTTLDLYVNQCQFGFYGISWVLWLVGAIGVVLIICVIVSTICCCCGKSKAHYEIVS